MTTVSYRALAASGRRLMFTLPLALALTGCATHREEIVFADEGAVRVVTASPAAQPAKPTLSPADEQAIELAVFSGLLERHFWDTENYSAVFLQAEDAQVTALMKKYPQHVPPVKPSYHADVRLNQTPRDKDTGKPAMILSVDINEPNDDGSVTALGKWFAGGAVTGFYIFTLQPTAGEWRVVDVR